MSTYIALCTVVLPDPNRPREFSGTFDGDGNPILKDGTITVAFGEEFELDDQDKIDRLMRQKAICRAEDYEPKQSSNPNHFPKRIGEGSFTRY